MACLIDKTGLPPRRLRKGLVISCPRAANAVDRDVRRALQDDGLEAQAIGPATPRHGCPVLAGRLGPRLCCNDRLERPHSTPLISGSPGDQSTRNRVGSNQGALGLPGLRGLQLGLVRTSGAVFDGTPLDSSGLLARTTRHALLFTTIGAAAHDRVASYRQDSEVKLVDVSALGDGFHNLLSIYTTASGDQIGIPLINGTHFLKLKPEGREQ